MKVMAGKLRSISIIDRLSSAGVRFSDIAVILLAFLITYEVIARYVFNNPTGFADEVSAYLLVSIVFFAAGYVVKEHKHITVDMLYRKFSEKTKLWMDVLADFLGILVWTVLMVEIAIVAQRSYIFSKNSTGIMETPLWIPQVVMCIGVFILVLQSFAELFKSIWALRTATAEQPAGEISSMVALAEGMAGGTSTDTDTQ